MKSGEERPVSAEQQDQLVADIDHVMLEVFEYAPLGWSGKAGITEVVAAMREAQVNAVAAIARRKYRNSTQYQYEAHAALKQSLRALGTLILAMPEEAVDIEE